MIGYIDETMMRERKRERGIEEERTSEISPPLLYQVVRRENGEIARAFRR